MHSFSFAKNLGSFVSIVPLGSIVELTTETHSTHDSAWVDRLDGGLAQSAKVCFFVRGETSEDQNLTISGNLQDATSSTGAGVADFGSSTQSLAVGSTATTADQDTSTVLAYNVDLTEANQYVRTQWSLAFSSASTANATNRATVFPVLVMGGFESLPST